MKTSQLLMVFVFVSLTSLILGSEYGTITGTVVDSELNTPVPGVEVSVEGTDIHTKTDTLGEFSIPFVPAGTYKVTARFVGYYYISYVGVVVHADRKTILNFSLSSNPISDESPNRAYKQTMDLSQTHSAQGLTSKEIERLPVTTIDEIIEIQPGVTQSDDGIHIRGGRPDEIIYYFDGISTKVPFTNWQYTNINPSIVEQMNIISGGFDAEYGAASSGVVNIITKDGGAKTKSTVLFLTDEILPIDKLNLGYNNYDFSLAGPRVRATRFGYFLSGKLMLTDAFQEALYKIPSPRNDYQVFGKLTYDLPNTKGSITVSGFRAREQYVVWSPHTEPGNAFKYFENKPMTRTKNWIASVKLSYRPNYNTLATLLIGTTHVDQVYGNRDYEWEQEHNRKWYQDYRFRAEHLIPSFLAAEDSAEIRALLIDSLMFYHEWSSMLAGPGFRHYPYAAEHLFYTYGDYEEWKYWQNNDIQMRCGIQTMMKEHTLKGGIDFTRYNIDYFENRRPWDSSPLFSYFKRTPYEVTGYLEDNVSFDNLTLRLGMSCSYFNSDTVRDTTWFYHDTLASAPQPYLAIAPRFGIALPITNRTKIRFNYGYYYQTKTDSFIIQQNVYEISAELQKTTMYELGFEHELPDNFAFGITAFSKETPNVRDVTGIESNVSKKMSSMLRLCMNYNLEFVRGTYAYVDYTYDSTLNWLSYDERHTIRAYLDLDFPHKFFFPIQGFANTFVFAYHSGHPYTPVDLNGNILANINSQRMPDYWNVDWKFSRSIKMGPTKFIVTGLINNFFSTKQIIDVYNTTGKPDDHGDPEPLLSQFGYLSMLSTRYTPQADYNHDGLITPVEKKADYMAAIKDRYIDPTNYKESFRMKLGVGVEL